MKNEKLKYTELTKTMKTKSEKKLKLKLKIKIKNTPQKTF